MMNTYARLPVEFVSGSGLWLTDAHGESYLDLMAGLAVASVGHSHPRVVSAIADQAQRLIHVSNLFSTGPQADLAQRLAGLTNGKRSFFCNSGAEAIECALKLARRWGRAKDQTKTRIVCAEGGFHGRTFGALSATGQPSKQIDFEPLVPGFVHVPFGDADALRGVMADDVAAVLVEPIQGEAGVVVPPDGYLHEVRAICDSWDALFVCDEIQTGLGRTGHWFAYEHEDVAPDVICLAKALAGGLPMGACLADPDVAAAFKPGDHATTFGGGPVQSAAALAVLDVIEDENLVERAATMGARLRQGLGPIVPDEIVRGRGLLLGIELARPIAAQVVAVALDKHLLVNNAAPNVVRLCPPLTIDESEVDRALEILAEVFDEVAAA
jgi:acetylornithine aminotransferase